MPLGRAGDATIHVRRNLAAPAISQRCGRGRYILVLALRVEANHGPRHDFLTPLRRQRNEGEMKGKEAICKEMKGRERKGQQ